MIVAVLDACVLYPPSLRDLLMWIADVRAYQPCWTVSIQTEWMRNALANNPNLLPSQLERTCSLMEVANPRGQISGYEAIIPRISLPDANDRHVLAAAIHASASYIVTFNLSDFPDSTLKYYHIKAIHPDIFPVSLFDDDAALFLQGVQKHRASLKNPPKTPDAYIGTLKANGLIELAIRIEAYRDVI